MRKLAFTGSAVAVVLLGAGCAPRPTADLSLGDCARFIALANSNRVIGGSLAGSSLGLSDEGSEFTGRVAMIGDPDDHPRHYRVTGPTLLSVGIHRAGQRSEFDLSLPAGTTITLADHTSLVRCEVAEAASR
ncbi:hypothetical protein [Brevundimonas sp. GCM10030266]|uniref:hypothetical protein n=1 Tax=Brevundimonas sp. GCM10030266 TaxID=3273386 RepID=UPI0036067A66